MEVQIKIKDIEEFSNFIELIEKYQYELPIELQKSLAEIAENGCGDIDRDYIEKHYIDATINSNSMGYDNLISINKILKRVKIFKNEKIKKIYLEHFWFKINDEIVVQW